MVEMKFQFLFSLASSWQWTKTNAFIEPESSFGASLIQAANSTRENGLEDAAFYTADEIPSDEYSNLYEPGTEPNVVTFDARSGKPANIDLSVPILPGDGQGNNLLWSVGFTDSADGHGKPKDDEEWQALSLNALQMWITSNESEMNIDSSELFVSSVTGDETSVSSSVHDDGDVIQFSLQRTFKGLSVKGGRASATIKGGNLVNIGFEKWGDIPSDFDVFPLVSVDEAYSILSQSTGVALERGETCEPELQILTTAVGGAPSPFSTSESTDKDLRASSGADEITRGPRGFGQGYTHSLVWKVCPKFQGQTIEMFEAYVDAKTAVIHSFRDTVEYFQAKGDVYPTSNDGKGLDGVLQQDWPMPFAYVGTETTDTGGNYFKSGNQVALFSGPYVKVIDYCGTASLNADKEHDWGGAGKAGNCNTPGYGGPGNTHSSRSGFYELNKMQEIARSHLPSNKWLKQQLRAYMNINNSCNAYWNGSTVNFYRSGNGCGNTGEIAAIFDHEWGHGMDRYDVVPGTSSPSGEGIADIYSALRLNDSCIGRGFFVSGLCSGNGNPCISCTGVRDIDYMQRRDKKPSTYSWAKTNCSGQVHCLGYVYSEAVWSLYKRHLQTAPYNFDDNTALEIVMRLTFIGAGNVGTWYSASNTKFGGCGTSSGYLQYLLADDDDGNLNNGTPHMKAIYNAFNAQEIACSTPAVVDYGCGGTPNVAPTVTSVAGDMRAILSWNAVDGASNYQVFRTEGVKQCGQGKVLLATLSSSALTYTDTGLQNGREYYYVVIPKGPKAACFGRASSCTTVIPAESSTKALPTANPTVTSSPTLSPSSSPTLRPNASPTRNPTKNPTSHPSELPIKSPTKNPTAHPSTSPTKKFTSSPTEPGQTNQPTRSPTQTPTTTNPTKHPVTIAPTPSNPCGNGICERGSENPTTCPADCTNDNLSTGSESDGNAKAVLFTATAFENVSFTSFAVVGKKRGKSLVEVYTRLGDYTGVEEIPDEWELCFSNEVQVLKNQMLNKNIIDSLECDTFTPAGGKRSFQVYSEKGMLIQKGVSASSNASVQLNSGVWLKDKFKQVKGQGTMSGEISFHSVS